MTRTVFPDDDRRIGDAPAKLSNEPLLFRGNNFGQTGVHSALSR